MINIPIQHHGKFTVILMLCIANLKKVLVQENFCPSFQKFLYTSLWGTNNFFKFE